MDSQERHDMKQNDLQEFLVNFREWWSKYGTILMLVILVALGGFVLARWYAGREARALEAAYSELDIARGSGNPFALQEVAVRYEDVPGVAGMARLEAADLIVREVLGLLPRQTDAPPLTEEEKKDQLEQAAQLYLRVIELDQSPLQVLNARLGLATVAETRGDFDAAREQYDRIQQQAGETWPALAHRAEQRMGDLGRIATPIEFPAPPDPPAIPGMGEGEFDSPLELPPGLIPGIGDMPEQPEQPEQSEQPEQTEQPDSSPPPAAPEPSAPEQQSAPPSEPEVEAESDS